MYFSLFCSYTALLIHLYLFFILTLRCWYIFFSLFLFSHFQACRRPLQNQHYNGCRIARHEKALTILFFETVLCAWLRRAPSPRRGELLEWFLRCSSPAVFSPAWWPLHHPRKPVCDTSLLRSLILPAERRPTTEDLTAHIIITFLQYRSHFL